MEQRISDLLRIAITSSVEFYMNVANHIEQLENTLEKYKEKFGELDNEDVQE